MRVHTSGSKTLYAPVLETLRQRPQEVSAEQSQRGRNDAERVEHQDCDFYGDLRRRERATSTQRGSVEDGSENDWNDHGEEGFVARR